MKSKRNILLLVTTPLVIPSFLIAASCETNAPKNTQNEEKYNAKLSELMNNIKKIEDKDIQDQFNNEALSIIESKKTDPKIKILERIEALLTEINKKLQGNNNPGGNSNPNPSITPEPTPTPQPSVSPKPNPGSNSNSSTFKWGHWNILNFTGNESKQKDKAKRISLLISEEKFDVLGLTEVVEENGIKKLVEDINKLTNSNLYSYTISGKEKGDKFNAGSAEYVAILYNKNKFEPIQFNNGQVGYSYKDKFNDNLGDSAAQYARPPYGVQFKYKLKPNTKMTFVFDHFDGPGKPKKDLGEKMIDGIGSFEYREAKHLGNVLQKFDSLGNNAGNIFFAGDTNIKTGREKKTFDWLDKYGGNLGYKSVFEDDKKYSSSLSTRGGFANPYDKMFYKTDFKLTNSFIFDIYKVAKQGDPLYELFKKHGVTIQDGKKIRNQNILSDHTYTVAEFQVQ
ncbi:Membrane nuclease A, predicted lipoprotein [Metamycoplasma auris 15026]|uniref:Membrane nuclease A, predicted lipoprotein n=1 Tax=Metamycoplasma auris 15026 TaxID=1188233 RepID=N9VAU4_9BACT|nr:endonuclease/exonuclease/phosphatase family protein [Metamycoplasma auris]ENY68536.1 Membrane nuclease A, predicted lipoprotein [Metamycoplasma auris 15026]